MQIVAEKTDTFQSIIYGDLFWYIKKWVKTEMRPISVV